MSRPRSKSPLSPVGLLLGLSLLAGCASSKGKAAAAATGDRRVPAVSLIAAKTAGFASRSGLLDLFVDVEHGKVLVRLPPARGPRGTIGEFIYYEGIVTGLGSNPVGLDRGQVGEPQLLRLRELGGKVLFEVVNLRFRALSESAEETRAVEESFANSVIWSAEVLARDAGGELLVDLGPFLLRDAHGVADRLAESGQGGFSFDREKSAIDVERCVAFPDNIELESTITFVGAKPGDEVRAVATEPVTFRAGGTASSGIGTSPTRTTPGCGRYPRSPPSPWTAHRFRMNCCGRPGNGSGWPRSVTLVPR